MTDSHTDDGVIGGDNAREETSAVCAWDIIEQVRGMARDMSRPAFRGQADSGWDLRSGVVHRIVETHGQDVLNDDGRLRMLVADCHKHLIRSAQTIDGDHNMPFWQRLAVLQHLGAATGLLDFTLSPLVALWFAVDGEPGKDGRVFAVDVDDHQILVNSREIGEEDLLNTGRPVFHEPEHTLGPRIRDQHSVFVLCNPPSIPESCVPYVDVPATSKESLREYLESLRVSNETLFRDMEGLARSNSRTSPLRVLDVPSPDELRDRGARAYQEQRYDDALAYYESYASARLHVPQSHVGVGDTLSALRRFGEAVDAYTLAIEHIDGPMDFGHGLWAGSPELRDWTLHAIYYNRGNVLAASGRHAEAVEDFDRALQHGGLGSPRNVLVNRGNSKYALGRFMEAARDFEAAWTEREESDAALAVGNCAMMLGKFPEAMRKYLAGATLNAPESSAAACRRHAENCKQLIEVLDGHDYEVQIHGRTVTVMGTIDATVTFQFTGNRGNQGNTGTMNMHRGEGYDGLPGFAVRLQPRQSAATGQHL